MPPGMPAPVEVPAVESPERELAPEVREVLAWAGAALLWSQMFEATLSAFTAIEDAEGPAPDGKQAKQSLTGRAEGASPNKPAKKGARHNYLANELQRSLQKKDYLVNDIFRSTRGKRLLSSEDGRRELMTELRGLAEEFQSWGVALAPAVLAYAVAEGRTNPDQLIARANALGKVSNVQESDLASQAQAALEIDPEKVEEMVQVLREVEARRAWAARRV